LPWQKIGKNHWQVTIQGHSTLTIQYKIFANELTVRTKHLDITHGYFNPAAMFFRVPSRERGEGKTNQDICDDLCISESTVKFHINNIFSKYTQVFFEFISCVNPDAKTNVAKFSAI
jgi:hypothetical protein